MNTTVRKAIASCAAFIDGRDDAMALPPVAAEFVYALILATGATRGVEIGTSFGYSGLHIGAALAENGGRLVTIDVLPTKSEAARAYFEQAGLGEVITCETGRAIDVINRLTGPVDFVLNDADKANCRPYVEALLPKLESRAVVLTDNSITHAAEVADFVEWVRKHPDFESFHVPIGNGFEMSVRR